MGSNQGEGPLDNGVPSAGDVVTLDYQGCTREIAVVAAVGNATVTIISVGAARNFVALLSVLSPGIAFRAPTRSGVDPDYYLYGKATLERSHSVTRTRIAASASGADRLYMAVPGVLYPPDHMSEFRLEKSSRRDEARIALSVQMRYTSDELGGSFNVRTPLPVLAWFDTLPEPFAQQGSFEMLGGGGDVLRVSMIGNEAGQDIAVALDQRGVGTIEAAGSGDQ
jgi:hypothetical protein